MKLSTHVIGEALSAFLDDRDIIANTLDDEGFIVEHPVRIRMVDDSDASNPVIILENGQRFVCRIIAI